MERRQKIRKEIDLSELPKWGKCGKAKEGSINWKESIGYKVKFIYDKIEDYIEIVRYNGNKNIKIRYNNEELNISTDMFQRASIGKILKERTSEFKIKIGTIFKDDKRDIAIIDREYRPIYNKNGSLKQNLKWYKYHCYKCTFEEWIEESHLLRGQSCSICCHNPKPVLGINTIYDTDKWMIPYIGEACAKTHTHCSSDKVEVVCPDCRQTKKSKIVISKIYNRHSIGCSCSDSVSYGEKFIFDLIKQLGIDFQTQLNKTTFNWCEKYKYDFYFRFNNEDILLESNGKQHYQDAWDKLEKTQLNDKNKKELALSNSIREENYMVIDCRESTLDWIKDHILESNLAKIFDLSKINWLQCHEFACSNLVKLASKYKNDNPNMTSTEIGEVMRYSNVTIQKWLKQGTIIGWCKYDTKEENRKSAENNRPKSNPIICITTGDIFNGIGKCESESLNILGIKLWQTGILEVLREEKPQYKGFHFKYISDLTQEEIKQIQENAKQQPLTQAI